MEAIINNLADVFNPLAVAHMTDALTSETAAEPHDSKLEEKMKEGCSVLLPRHLVSNPKQALASN